MIDERHACFELLRRGGDYACSFVSTAAPAVTMAPSLHTPTPSDPITPLCAGSKTTLVPRSPLGSASSASQRGPSGRRAKAEQEAAALPFPASAATPARA